MDDLGACGGGDASADQEVFRGEDRRGRMGRNIQELLGGTRFQADLEEDFAFAFEDEAAEYNDEELQGMGMFSAAEKPVDLFEAPEFEVVKTTMENVTPDEGVKKVVLKKGNGIKLPSGCKVWYHYVAFVEGENDPYDSTIARKTTQSSVLKLDEIDVFEGLFHALLTMELQETSQFMFKPEYAFGAMGSPPRIPKHATIFMNVKIVNMITAAQLNTVEHMTPERRAMEPFERISEAARQKRTEGNQSYKVKKYAAAIRLGIAFLEDYSDLTTEQDKERNAMLATMYCNMGQCYLRMDKFPQACVACQNGFRNNDGDAKLESKLSFRLAQAKFYLRTYDGALFYVRRCLSVGGESVKKDVKEFETKILDAIKERDAEFRAIERRMAHALINGEDDKDRN